MDGANQSAPSLLCGEKLPAPSHSSGTTWPKPLLSLRNLLEKERNRPIAAEYLETIQYNLTEYMRKLTVEWLFEIGEWFGVQSDTVVLAAQFLDFHLSKSKPVAPSQFQLVALACFQIATKIRERAIPSLVDVLDAAHNIYQEVELRQTERAVLKVLRWHPTAFLTPSVFVDPLITALEIPDALELHNTVNVYLMAAACEYSLAPFSPSLQCVCALECALSAAELEDHVDTDAMIALGIDMTLREECLVHMRAVHASLEMEYVSKDEDSKIAAQSPTSIRHV